MDRDELAALRPMLPINVSENMPLLERFQNETLRPVIKMQHEVIILLFTSHPLAMNLSRNKGPRLVFEKKVKDFINGQPALKNQLIGLISGMLTSSEMEFYINNQNELNKRIHSMLCQRISDTVYN
jgi:hypothetical protein